MPTKASWFLRYTTRLLVMISEHGTRRRKIHIIVASYGKQRKGLEGRKEERKEERKEGREDGRPN